MLLDNLVLAIVEAVNYLKKNILMIIVVSFFLFFVIWLGNVIAVITSRSILDHVSVKIEGLAPANLSSIRVLATLSRAGNTINLTRSFEKEQNEWNNPSDTFIKKILIGLNNEDLEQFSGVTVALGAESFVYSKDRFLKEWKKMEIENDDWYMRDVNGRADYSVYEAPENVKIKPWDIQVPLVSSLLSSINFRGSEYLIRAPLILSVKIFLLIIAILAEIFIIILLLRRNIGNFYTSENVERSKREFIVFVFSVSSTALILFFLCILIRFLYKPDITQTLLNASVVYLDKFLPSLMPKPTERAQFISSVLVSPFLLFFTYKLFTKKVSKIKDLVIDRLYFILSIVVPLTFFGLIFVGLAVSNFMYIEKSYYFNDVGKYLYSLVLFPVGVYIIFSSKHVMKSRLFKILLYLFFGILIIIFFFLGLFSPYGLNFNPAEIVNHANPIFYAISQVVAGKTMLVDLTGLYGLYPMFLEPVFHLFGSSILSTTAVMGTLIVMELLFILLFLQRIIKNKIILLLGFSTVVLYLLNAPGSPYPYFQYWPIRTFFPTLFLLLSSYYFGNKNKILYIALFLLGSLSVLWNFDSGIFIFMSWILALFYLELFGKNKKIMFRNIVFHVLMGIISLSLVFACYAVYSFLRSGSFPDFSLFTAYQKMFYDGFFLIKMPFPHIWVVIVLFFLVGLLSSIKNLLHNEKSWENISIFFLSVLSIGLFSYYEGRSHDATLYNPLYLVFMLLTIYVENMFIRIANSRELYGDTLLFLMAFYFLFSSPVTIISHSGKYYEWVRSGFNVLLSRTESSLTKNIDFIKENIKEGEKIVLLTKGFDGIYYTESHSRSAMDIPSFTDLVFKHEADYAVDFLRCNKAYKVFIYPFSEFYTQSGHDLLDKRVNQTIENYYAVVSTSTADMALLLNNQENFDNCFENK